MPDVQLHLGDCLAVLPTIPDASVDAVISDPPYPEISRPYGRMTEAEWHEMMREVVRQTRRILKPTGSAVFILQPNSRKVGSMRAWLFEFQAWCCREWNMVQDAWWWNTNAIPGGGEGNKRGLMRPSVKACVWLGDPGCYRDRNSVLGVPSQRCASQIKRYAGQKRSGEKFSASGIGIDDARAAHSVATNGGVTPFNLLAMHHGDGNRSAGAYGHPAGTPLAVADWWTRYACPPDGVVADWFMGSGTMGLAALKRGRSFIGIEKMESYFETAQRRIADVQGAQPLFANA